MKRVLFVDDDVQVLEALRLVLRRRAREWVPDKVTAILARMQVPNHEGLYVLGCFERPATFYMQQIRALNLIYALSRIGHSEPQTLAVVGAGRCGYYDGSCGCHAPMAGDDFRRSCANPVWTTSGEDHTVRRHFGVGEPHRYFRAAPAAGLRPSTV